MANLIASVIGAIVGIGGVTSAFVVPTLLSKGEGSSVTSNVQDTTSRKETETTKEIVKPKPRSEWVNPEDYKKYCFGGFLSEKDKGELIVCQEQDNLPLFFYLFWKDKGSETYSPIEVDDVVMNSIPNNRKEIWFWKDRKSLNKKIIVDKRQHKNIDDLLVSLTKCKTETNNDSVYLSCTDTITKKTFKTLLNKGQFTFLN